MVVNLQEVGVWILLPYCIIYGILTFYVLLTYTHFYSYFPYAFRVRIEESNVGSAYLFLLHGVRFTRVITIHASCTVKLVYLGYSFSCMAYMYQRLSHATLSVCLSSQLSLI